MIYWVEVTLLHFSVFCFFLHFRSSGQKNLVFRFLFFRSSGFSLMYPTQANTSLSNIGMTVRGARWLTGHCFLNRNNNLLNSTEFPSPNCNWDQGTNIFLHQDLLKSPKLGFSPGSGNTGTRTPFSALKPGCHYCVNACITGAFA